MIYNLVPIALAMQQASLAQQDEIRSHSEKEISELNDQHQHKTAEILQQLDAKRDHLQALSVERASLSGKRYFEEEIKALKSSVEQSNLEIRQIEIENENLRNQIKAKQEELEIKSSARRESFSHSRERSDEKIKALSEKTREIDRKLSNSKDSFYGWLNEHYPSWEDTIGKVCDEHVLFHLDLNPSLSTTDTPSFYGIELELEEIGRTVKTVADYEQEKATIALEIKQAEAGIRELSAQLETVLDKLQKNTLSAVKGLKISLEENAYSLEQSRKRGEKAKSDLDALEEKAEAEKIAAIEQINHHIAEATEAVRIAREQLEATEADHQAQVKALKNIRTQKLQAVKEEANSAVLKIKEEIEEKKVNTDHRLNETKTRQNEELAGKGADTARLSTIEQELVSIRKELRFIEDKRDAVSDYRKDKRELFNKVGEFHQQKNVQQDLLQQETQRYASLKADKERKIAQKQEVINSLSATISAIQEDLQEFQTFTGTDCYKYLSQLFQEPPARDKPLKTELSGVRLIRELSNTFYDGINKINQLKEAVTKFLGHFSVNNIFNFRTGLIENEEYLQFATDLHDFMEEDKIAQYEKRVNTRFSDIIRLIGQETTTLVSKEGEIQKVISRINKDFESKNFVGAIKKIELRLEESANRIVLILKEIKAFNDEHAMNLGEQNLFSSQHQDTNNKKAIDLLRLLLQEIHNLKRNAISLSDSFELKFRIIENNNDTGWVENLSNVGSEGTDVLVKAMINIMLLNVFKDWASKNSQDFKLHCMMDEIGKLHPSNVRGILKFANDRNILLINGSPTENDALAYRHIYKLAKDQNSVTKVKRILTQHSSHEVTA